VPRLRDRNQPDGLIVNQRDALIVTSTLPLRCALTECRVRWSESTSRVQHALRPGCGLRNGVRILITFLRESSRSRWSTG